LNEIALRVRYSETDAMGVVHHANYIRWFEVGRTEYLRSVGINYAQMERDGVYAPILRVEVEYKRPAAYDDEVIIQTRVLSFAQLRLRFGYRVLNMRRELLCEGLTVQAFVGRDLNPINPYKAIPDAVALMLKCAEKDKADG